MTNQKNIFIAAIVIGLLSGCASRSHLGFDYGDSYISAFSTQADLTRTTIAASEYKLSGLEAASIRIQAQEATTDAEGGSSEEGK